MNSHFKKSVIGRTVSVFFLILSFSFIANSAFSQLVFLGTIDQSWSNESNWADGNRPTNGATGLSIIISANVDVDFAGWSLASGSSMTINSGVTATFSVSGNSAYFNLGTINNSGTIVIPGNDQFQNNGTINNNPSGIMDINETFTNTTIGTLNNNGVINIGDQNSDSFINSGILVNNGTINLNNGTLAQRNGDAASISGSGNFNLEDGNTGNGTGDGILNLESGSLSPGNSFGTMTIVGTVTLSGMTLNMEVGGDGPAFRDLLSVTGTLTLSGSNTLNMIYGPGEFTPGESWTVIDVTGTFSGTFTSEVDFPPASVPSATLTASYTASSVVITHTGATFLPIELTTFSGQVINNSIELNWTTATELNNDYMIIERSADGLEFRDVGRVDGKGTTTEAQFYSYLDQAPLNGYNYYRLRQVDIDGTEHYSNVIVINLDMAIDGIKLFAYPNPSQDRVRISWQSSSTTDKGAIQLIEMATGKVLQRFVMLEGTNMMDIPVQDLPSGQYVIQVVQADQQKAIQFVKN